MIKHLCYFSFTAFLMLALISLCASIPLYAAETSIWQISATTKATIVLPKETIPSEETAAKELQHYLTQITGAALQVVRESDASSLTGTLIYVGPTQFTQKHLNDKSTFYDEEWLMQTTGNALILTGGRPRGTLYGVYHFLEEIGGVRWWNPWEETVPERKVLSVTNLHKRSQPAFHYRDIHQLYAGDGGRFMARSRLDRQGDTPVDAKYGGSRNYGPPYHVHTMWLYLPPSKYFKDHPEWFLGKFGDKEPGKFDYQLAVSNPELRKEFLRLLLDNIRTSHAEAATKKLPPPQVFAVSQNDNALSFSSSPADEALVKENGDADSAVLLSFINYLADNVKEEFPDIYIETLAYHNSEKAPTKIKPRDNVIIRLTDTQSNVLLPITAERNHAMRKNVDDWAKICKNLRVWDYAITYRATPLPHPTMHTYQPDLQYFNKHRLDGMFIEFEEPTRADMRDLKLWVLCKLLEDPNQNYDALVKEFTDGYYGDAGSYIRQYIKALETAAQKSKSDVNWFSLQGAFTYLTTDFLLEADALFDKAAAAVQQDTVLMQRVAWARTSVDYAITRQFRPLLRQWVQQGHPESTFPLDRIAAGDRYLDAMTTLTHQRIPEKDQATELRKIQSVRDQATAQIPEKFSHVSQSKIFVYGASNTRNAYDTAKVIEDTDSASGFATRLMIPEDKLKRYKMPMEWGIYDTVGKKTTERHIPTAEVPGPGYHWYKMDDVTLSGNDYFYLFWSWLIQVDIADAFDAQYPDKKYEIWASLKFEGPDFPHGKTEDKNAISVEQIVILEK